MCTWHGDFLLIRMRTQTSDKGEGVAYVMRQHYRPGLTVIVIAMALSVAQQDDWPHVCCVALSATGQPEATSPLVYTNWVEQHYGSPADCDYVYYRLYCWFVHLNTTGHPLRLQSICLPGQEEGHATCMPHGPSTWQSWVPVSESKYMLIGLFCQKKYLYIFIFGYAFDFTTRFGNFCQLQASTRKSNYNAPVLKYIHNIKSYYLNKCC